MRFVFNDPYTLRGAVHEMAGSQPVATRVRDLPIPVDVYQLDKEIVIEGAIPRARLEDLDLSCQDGLLTLAKGGDTSPGVTSKPEVIEAVKGRGYREVAVNSNRRKGRRK